jgi:uncharacterized protein
VRFREVRQQQCVWPAIHSTRKDYPFTTVQATLDGMRKLNCILEGTALPRLDMDKMEQMFERDSLRLLELE